MYPSNVGQLLQVCNAALKCVFGASSWYQLFVVLYSAPVVGSCHHGMARPQVADRGTASDMEGSCE